MSFFSFFCCFPNNHKHCPQSLDEAIYSRFAALSSMFESTNGFIVTCTIYVRRIESLFVIQMNDHEYRRQTHFQSSL